MPQKKLAENFNKFPIWIIHRFSKLEKQPNVLKAAIYALRVFINFSNKYEFTCLRPKQSDIDNYKCIDPIIVLKISFKVLNISREILLTNVFLVAKLYKCPSLYPYVR